MSGQFCDTNVANIFTFLNIELKLPSLHHICTYAQFRLVLDLEMADIDYILIKFIKQIVAGLYI